MVGDVVILKDDTTKRMFWKLVIIELLTGKDGQVRAAIVKVANHKGEQSRLRCSLKHLIPLEVRNEMKVTN